jgi:hypothetical protein
VILSSRLLVILLTCSTAYVGKLADIFPLGEGLKRYFDVATFDVFKFGPRMAVRMMA